MPSTTVTFGSLLKRRFDSTTVENLTQADRPLMALIPKDEGGSGDGHHIPLIYGNPQGLAANLAGAQSASSNIKGKHFLLTYGDYVGSVEIGDKVLMASRNNPGAFLQNKVQEIEGLYSQAADDLATFLYGNGGMALGRRASLSSNTVTLTEPSDVFRFEEGMTVVASDNDGSDSGHALRTGSTTITSVDRTSGKITLANAAAISSFADNDYLFRANLFAGNTTNYTIAGLQAFIASSDSPANLYSMVRTADPTRLAGCRVPSSALAGKSIMEKLQLLGTYMTGRYKSTKFDTVLMHPEDRQNLETALMSQGYRSVDDDTTQFGFQVIKATIGGRAVKIYSDPFCPKGTAFVIAPKFWKLWSMGKLFRPVEEDGLYLLRKATTNDYEHRMICYPAFVTNAPLYHGRVAV